MARPAKALRLEVAPPRDIPDGEVAPRLARATEILARAAERRRRREGGEAERTAGEGSAPPAGKIRP